MYPRASTDAASTDAASTDAAYTEAASTDAADGTPSRCACEPVVPAARGAGAGLLGGR